ncbi:MAG: hypothetical protein HZA51_00905 [Planctomycetes bacterium]|nr:hypothetical protein [Planctomycetota bacterium]
MWPFSKAKSKYQFDLTKVFRAEPTRDMPMVCRWGNVNNLGISGEQFNVYWDGEAYFLTMQDQSGIESEKMIYVEGGRCSTLLDAYTKASSLLCDLLITSVMADMPMHSFLFVDTSHNTESIPLALFEAKKGDKIAWETRLDAFNLLIAQAEPVRTWTVVDQAGQCIATFRIFGGDSEYRVTCEFHVSYEQAATKYATSIEDAYAQMLKVLPPLMRANESWATLFIVDRSSSDDTANKLGVIQIAEFGIVESRRYNPETMKLYADPITRMVGET